MLNKTPMGEQERVITPGRAVHSQLRNKSQFNPPVHNNEHIKVFNKMVLRVKVKRMTDPQAICKGIKELEENKKVVIRPANRGGAIVVLSKEYYNKELLNQLSDTDPN